MSRALPQAFRKLRDKIDVARLQDAIAEVLDALLDVVVLRGVYLEDVAISTSGTEIPHTLGRRWRGWKLCDVDVDARVWRESSSDETKFLKLRASSTATAKVWVF